jgi:transcriptional regulator with XRE-family HTH domain
MQKAPAVFISDFPIVQEGPAMSADRFAGRLKELREQAGLTQPGLADRAGLSKAGIADLEQGRREPSWSTAVALAGALGVEVTAFLKEPAPRQQTGRGRPPKRTEKEEEEPAPKRPKGRPRKK